MESVPLPKEIWQMIFSWLPLAAAVKAAPTCRVFYRALTLHRGWVDTWSALWITINEFLFRDVSKIQGIFAGLEAHLNFGKGFLFSFRVTNHMDVYTSTVKPRFEFTMPDLRLEDAQRLYRWIQVRTEVQGDGTFFFLDRHELDLYATLTGRDMRASTARWMIINFIRQYTSITSHLYMRLLMTRCVDSHPHRFLHGFDLNAWPLTCFRRDLGFAGEINRYFAADPENLTFVVEETVFAAPLKYFFDTATRLGLIDHTGARVDPPWIATKKQRRAPVAETMD
jgi:hypothetical protein